MPRASTSIECMSLITPDVMMRSFLFRPWFCLRPASSIHVSISPRSVRSSHRRLRFPIPDTVYLGTCPECLRFMSADRLHPLEMAFCSALLWSLVLLPLFLLLRKLSPFSKSQLHNIPGPPAESFVKGASICMSFLSVLLTFNCLAQDIRG